MENPIAFCGLHCETCPAYIAKQTDDQALRIKTAQIWGSVGFHVQSDEVNCDGCHSGGVLLAHCDSCAVRKCGEKKQLLHCGLCEAYPCDQLTSLWQELHITEAKDRLDKLRSQSRLNHL